MRERVLGPPQPFWRGEVWQSDRIKVAYIRGQPMAYLMAELLELHDRSQFETIMTSYAPDDGSEMRARIVVGPDQFFDVTTMSDADVARLLYDLRVDIAVDLQGHHRGARPGILAFRPTPIQVNYLGFPGTMGADFIDYIIADPIVLPLERQPYYAENIVRLTCPLFDTDRFRRHLEAAYRQMWELWQNGEKPKGFKVAAIDNARATAATSSLTSGWVEATIA